MKVECVDQRRVVGSDAGEPRRDAAWRDRDQIARVGDVYPAPHVRRSGAEAVDRSGVEPREHRVQQDETFVGDGPLRLPAITGRIRAWSMRQVRGNR